MNRTELISNTSDQALLAYVIKKAYELDNSDKKSYIGRTAIQKITYFTSVLGVPSSYRFDMYTFGPFSSEILQDMEWLEADEIIVDESNDKKRKSFYRPGPMASALIKEHQEFITKHKAILDMVIKGLAKADANTLELAATLDFLYRWYKASAINEPIRQLVLKRLEEIKPGKFTQEQANRMFDWLVKSRLASD